VYQAWRDALSQVLPRRPRDPGNSPACFATEAALPEKRSIVDLDIRLIAALDPHPEASLADGRFRGDLYDRLRQVRIDMPPLCRRRQDISLLAARFLRAGRRERSTAAVHAVLDGAPSALPRPGNGRG
jgi:DNA-binding NtrC family response regulator